MTNNVYPCKPQFYYVEMGSKGVILYRRVFVMYCSVSLDVSVLFPFQTILPVLLLASLRSTSVKQR